MIIASFFFLLRCTASLLAKRSYGGETEGLSLFDLGCAALPPPRPWPYRGIMASPGAPGGVL